MPDRPTFETLEEELDLVLSRHSDLLGSKEGAARAAATLIKKADKAARPFTLDVEADVHEDGVVAIGYPKQETLAFLGSYQQGDWLDEMTVDVSRYTHIEIRADGDPR
jgi:hypothetical protein